MPTQANTIPAQASTSPDMPAHSRTTVEPPSKKRKPLCERYLHRWIRPSFPFRGGRQAGLGECRQGIEVKRLVHRCELAETTHASRSLCPFWPGNKREAKIDFKLLYACNRIYGIFAGSYIVSAYACLAHRLPEFPLRLATHSLGLYPRIDERTIP